MITTFVNGHTHPARLCRAFTLLELLLVILVVGVICALIFTPRRYAPEAVRRMVCGNNLKQLALAMQSYHTAYGCFPPAYTVDASGNRLHSWRTLLLPYLDQGQSLYDRIDLSKSWDDPANAAVRNSQTPTAYVCPVASKLLTCYMVIVDPQSCFPGTSTVQLKQITDGISDTILLIESPPNCAIEWMSPFDADLAMFTGIDEATELAHKDIVMAAMADGSYRAIPRELSVSDKTSLLTIAAGDKVTRKDLAPRGRAR